MFGRRSRSRRREIKSSKKGNRKITTNVNGSDFLERLNKHPLFKRQGRRLNSSDHDIPNENTSGNEYNPYGANGYSTSNTVYNSYGQTNYNHGINCTTNPACGQYPIRSSYFYSGQFTGNSNTSTTGINSVGNGSYGLNSSQNSVMNQLAGGGPYATLPSGGGVPSVQQPIPYAVTPPLSVNSGPNATTTPAVGQPPGTNESPPPNLDGNGNSEYTNQPIPSVVPKPPSVNTGQNVPTTPDAGQKPGTDESPPPTLDGNGDS